MRVILEPTGSYHWVAARAFHLLGCQVILANPFRVREFGKAAGTLNKTDKLDAKTLAHYGEQVPLRLWQPPPSAIIELGALLARLQSLQLSIRREPTEDATWMGCKLPDAVCGSRDRILYHLIAERTRAERQIERFFEENVALGRELTLLKTIPGIGPLVAAHLLLFLRAKLFETARQAAASLGVVPRHRESGTSLFHRQRLSKAGNIRLRALLYMCAMSALKSDPHARARYEKLKAKGKPGKAALVAVAHSLLRQAHGVLRSGLPYDPHHARLRRTGKLDSSTPVVPQKLR